MKRFALFVLPLLLTFSISLNGQQPTRQDSVCFDKETGKRIAIQLQNYESLIHINESLMRSYELKTQELVVTDGIVEGLKILRKQDAEEHKVLTDQLRKSIVSRRKWRRARTEIALLLK